MDPSDTTSPPPGRAPSYALRVTFAYRGNDVRVVDSRRIEMIAPPVVTPIPHDGQSGYWVQITDPAGRVIWHRPLSNPIAVDVEAFADDRRQTIVRVPVSRIEGQFSVLVPDLSEAGELALHGPPDARIPDAPAAEILAVPLESLRKFTPRPPVAGPSGTGAPKGN